MDKTKVVLELISVRDNIRDAVPARHEITRKKMLQKIENVITEILDENKVVLRREAKDPFKFCSPIAIQKGGVDENNNNTR